MKNKLPDNLQLENYFIKTWRPYFWILFIGIVLYFQNIYFNYVYLDDKAVILDNYYFLHKISSFFTVFYKDFFNSFSQAYYRPIAVLSFVIDAQLGGTSPLIYHVTNIIIHLISACLFFVFLKKLGYKRELCLIFGLLFTVHPALTQAVSMIVGRTDSLLGLFILAAFTSFLKYTESGKKAYCILHILFFLLALLSKESAIVLTIMCLFYLYLISKNGILFIKKIYLILGWVFVIILWYLLRKIAFSNPLNISLKDMLDSLWINLPSLVQFIGKIIFPFNLSVFTAIKDSTMIFGFTAVVLICIALFLTKNKRWNYIIFGLVWFLLFLIPSMLTPFSNVPTYMEQRIYVPIIGFTIVLLETFLFKNGLSNRKIFWVISVFVIIAFSIITFTYSKNYKDKISYWENAVKNSPSSPFAHRNLGAMYYLDGLLDKAKIEFEKSIELNPYEPMAHNNLGLVYMHKGLLKEAENEYKKELEINPLYDSAYFNLALLYFNEGRFKDAAGLWEKTIEINPNYIDAYNNLAVYYYEQKDFKKAIYYLDCLTTRGIKVNPKLMELLKSYRE